MEMPSPQAHRNPFRRRSRHLINEHPASSLVLAFLSELRSSLRYGHLSSESEAHLRHMFRVLGQNSDPQQLAAQVDREVERLEREASLLKRLRQRFFGSAL